MIQNCMQKLHNIRRREQGFTIVELLMALAVFSFVLVLVTTVFIQIFRTYARGITRKEVNQSARLLLDDMSSKLKSIPSSAQVVSLPANGRLCFGGYSYVWNPVVKPVGWTDNKINGTTIDTIVRIDGDIGGTACSDLSPNITVGTPRSLFSNRVGVQTVSATQASQVSGVYTISVTTSTKSTDLLNAANQCKQGIVGSQFCSQITLTETIARRNR